MSPTPRAAIALALLALVALFVPVAFRSRWLVFVAAVVCDTLVARRPLRVDAHMPRSRVPSHLTVGFGARSRRIRQAQPRIAITPPTGTAVRRRASASARRHDLPAPAARRAGPLGLATWSFGRGEPAPVLAYPDVPAARRLVIALRRGRFREPGQRTRGPLGLGTEFESVREYLPDDDVRQINWLATSRMGRPMSNQYRVEQDRDIVCVLDVGGSWPRPSASSRLDRAVDAVTAVAFVADDVGDRIGLVAFGSRESAAG
jgi:uncharacterized protein (DUF58 family)